MEFEDLDEKMEWEARRVAAAFGVGEWAESTRIVVKDNMERVLRDFDARVPDDRISWCLDANLGELRWIEIGVEGALCCSIWYQHMWQPYAMWRWGFSPEPQYHEIMARGLYRLGFEDENILSLLPPLLAHEKLELRLSMPREFWPQKWLDEEGQSTG